MKKNGRKQAAAPKRARRRGRPKGSTTKGPTVQVGMRLSRDLWETIDRLRRQSSELKSQTAMIEELIRRNLADFPKAT